MLLVLQTAAAVILLLAVVPLFVWANTGRLSSAWYALKRYLLCLAILIVPAVAFCSVYWFMVSP